jgi:hypothetical protein
MDKRIAENLNNINNNYILPFLWLHGEELDLISEEIEKIFESGIRALCVESRIHPDFCRVGWWKTFDLIMEECKKRSMKVWLLDDKYFPTGYANGLVVEKYPHLRKWFLVEKHMDIAGPQNDAAVLLAPWLKHETEDSIVCAVACRRSGNAEELLPACIELTYRIKGDFLYWNVPEGVWRVFIFIKTRAGAIGNYINYIDFINPDSVDVLIEAVYKPHYERYKDDFGKTFAGFFTDEPCFGNGRGFEVTLGVRDVPLPWRDDMTELLREKTGEDPKLLFPALWYGMGEKTSVIRTAYMNVISGLYGKHFCQRLGDWCRNHGVEYIGHVVEDMNSHARMGISAGHYFRSLDGQDMAGIDLVKSQILPGFEDYSHAISASSKKDDPEFYNYVLAKLGSSHAHIQECKNGRAMCELFGAYGWSLGLPVMKWLTDHMMVRGINYYVPHAFSPKYPDQDCPPHFYARGWNPQFRHFKNLMVYTNRLCHIFNDGTHISTAAILYHAEAEWSGGRFMLMQKPAKELADNQVDYDIVPVDALLKTAVVKNKKMVINNEKFDCLIVPYSEILPFDVIKMIWDFARAGLMVMFVDNFPVKSAENKPIYKFLEHDDMHIVPLDEIVNCLREHDMYDIRLRDPFKMLRFYHYQRDEADFYMFFNESERTEFSTEIFLRSGGTYIMYDAMENVVMRGETSNKNSILLSIEPYQSIVIAFGSDISGFDECPVDIKYVEIPLTINFEISLAATPEYLNFESYKQNSGLLNITSPDNLQEFCGIIKYEGKFNYLEPVTEGCLLDLGFVGETVEITLNGINLGVRICNPYVYNLSKALKIGENQIKIMVANNPAYREKDLFSCYMVLKPSGLLGPLTLKVPQ